MPSRRQYYSRFFTFNLGIIIDSFGLLRDQENYVDYDVKYFCFICGLHRENFDDFNYHIKFTHQKWNYLYFVAYIK